ncbi:hypothetical protein BGZ79_006946 [Entomortierella chlamydospora]|nr:hypothetical protein BGZ79_006946 [Entomortierella chlamydospora]
MRSIALISLAAFILGCVSASPAESTAASKAAVSENPNDKYGGGHGHGYSRGGHGHGHGHGHRYRRDEITINESDVDADYSQYHHGRSHKGYYGECEESYPSEYGCSRGGRGH